MTDDQCGREALVDFVVSLILTCSGTFLIATFCL